MTILGIDPGYGTIGYGVVRFENFKFTPVQYGAATTKAGMPMHLRLCEIYDDIGTLVDTFHPDEVAIEELFFSKNIPRQEILSSSVVPHLSRDPDAR